MNIDLSDASFLLPSTESFEKGEKTFSEALDRIQQARQQVERARQLLQKSGSTNPNRAIAFRYRQVLDQPLLEEMDPELYLLRQELIQTMRNLEEFFKQHF